MNQQIDIPGVGIVEFPTSMSDADIEQAAAKLHADATAPKAQTSGALWLQAASKAIPAAENVVQAGLNAPNAPRIIQRAINLGVRGAGAAAGAAVAGPAGATTGALISEGLAPTQQTVRAWLGRTATSAATKAAPAAEDAVVNYIEAMGANPANLTGAALEYAKKAGRAIIYDASGRASLVPSQAVADAAANTPAAVAKTAPSWIGKAAYGLSVLSAVQGGLDLAQMAEPGRQDIGFLGIGKSKTDNTPSAEALKQLPALVRTVQAAVAKGQSPAQAIQLITGGNPQLMGPLMMAYMKAQQVK